MLGQRAVNINCFAEGDLTFIFDSFESGSCVSQKDRKPEWSLRPPPRSTDTELSPRGGSDLPRSGKSKMRPGLMQVTLKPKGDVPVLKATS